MTAPEEITRADIEAVAATEGKPVLEVISLLQAGAALLDDGEKVLDRLCAIKADILDEQALARRESALVLALREIERLTDGPNCLADALDTIGEFARRTLSAHARARRGLAAAAQEASAELASEICEDARLAKGMAVSLIQAAFRRGALWQLEAIERAEDGAARRD